MNLDTFTLSYAVAALWSSPGDNGEPLDDGYTVSDIAPDTMVRMRADCAAFIADNAADLAEYGRRRLSLLWSPEELAGHDLWLTRNGHGAGFWDRGLGELGDRLTAAAEKLGGVDLYIGDDGKVHA